MASQTATKKKAAPKKKGPAPLKAQVDEQGDMIREVNAKVGDLGECLANISSKLEMIITAKEAPAIIHKTIEPMEMDAGRDGEAKLEASEGEVNLIKPVLGDINDPLIAEKVAMEAFMNEMVKVEIQETHEENAQLVFEITVNGIKELFHRGEQKTVKRCFVEGLARARPVSFACTEYIQEDGTRAFKYPARQGLRFPFSVIEDPNKMGKDWLRHVMKQP